MAPFWLRAMTLKSRASRRAIARTFDAACPAARADARHEAGHNEFNGGTPEFAAGYPEFRGVGNCAKASRRTQHPLQMLGMLSSSRLPCCLTAARAGARRDLDAAYRVRLIFTARCTGGTR